MFGRKALSLFVVLTLVVSVFPYQAAKAADPTISVKLVNYIGNKTSIPFYTVGDFVIPDGSANERLDGSDRFDVAVNVSKEGWTSTAGTVIIANYLAFADALAAAPLAYKENAPILLTHPNNLTDATREEIKRLNPERVILIGGTASISTNVGNQVKQLVGNVDRIGGGDRFEVAYNISKDLGTSSKAVIANGLKFPDALAIAPYAAKEGYPILLTLDNRLPTATKSALSGKNETLVIGGEGSVGQSVYDQLPGRKRIGGADRYEVATNIVRELNLPAEKAFLATGLTFADALTGSVLAAKQEAPLLLSRPERLPQATLGLITDKSIPNFSVLGGTASISSEVMSTLPSGIPIEQNKVYYVKSADQNLVLYKGGERVKALGASFTVKPDRYTSNSRMMLNNSRTYIGDMEFTLENGYVRPINRDIPFEDYLKGVVPNEMPASWSLEALKAQTVAARTYSFDDIGKVVKDDQSYQVYSGFGSWHSKTNQAVNETTGKVLRYNGKLIGAFYSSSNGGLTESNANVWGGTPLPYLPQQKDPYDPKIQFDLTVNKTQIDLNELQKLHPEHDALQNPGHWWWSVSEKDSSVSYSIKSWIKRNGYADQDIKIVGFSEFTLGTGTRAKSTNIVVEFFVRNPDTGEFVMNEQKQLKKLSKTISNTTIMRSAFGAGNIKSSLIDSFTYDSTIDSYKIIGRGYGHGIGMSQHGAQEMAESGKKYQEILSHYYPGTDLN
ncbi:SpoIID/LytB domain-containing protein [Pseudalkalibacillus caeni]|uniref:SpoIID/LytB domain-containing protein n=1 Tax=Exobacillus caeni TaxID=2574798 RepID=A0A5R9F4N5_9BACL|nr:SpoIID/LytB domain-containing protein [Pseudalkalibacillus caeni]TLS38487.1 SpoIID/LytB domain-containing protein [Pseudalkalibacillus caeni]